MGTCPLPLPTVNSQLPSTFLTREERREKQEPGGESQQPLQVGELRGEERPGLPIQVSPFLTPSPLLPHPTQHYKTPSLPVSHSPHCSLSPRLNCLLANQRLTTGLPFRKLEGFTAATSSTFPNAFQRPILNFVNTLF